MNNETPKTPAIVVLSGGMDSTILLHIVKKNYEVEALTFYYGQKQAIEVERAKATCEKYGITHKLIDISFLGELVRDVTSNIKGSNIEVPDAQDVERDVQPVTYVPNRNMILMNIAVSRAEAIGASRVFVGLQQHDHYGYWDCTKEFLDNLNATLAHNRDHHIEVVAPFIHLSKADELKLLISEYGAEETRCMMRHTITCYNPNEQGESCGKCPSCNERLKAFEQVGIYDSIFYQGN